MIITRTAAAATAAKATRSHHYSNTTTAQHSTAHSRGKISKINGERKKQRVIEIIELVGFWWTIDRSIDRWCVHYTHRWLLHFFFCCLALSSPPNLRAHSNRVEASYDSHCCEIIGLAQSDGNVYYGTTDTGWMWAQCTAVCQSCFYLFLSLHCIV